MHIDRRMYDNFFLKVEESDNEAKTILYFSTH